VPKEVGEKTELGLGVLGAATVLGVLGDLLLRETPWGLNFFLWIAALVALVFALARWRGVALHGGGRWLVAPLVLFAGLFVWRDSEMLVFIDFLCVCVALSLAALTSRSGSIVRSGIADHLFRGAQAAFHAWASPLPVAVRDISWRELQPRGGGPLFAVVRGLLIAAPLLLVFGALFVAADAIFERLVMDIFDFDAEEVFIHAFLFGFFAWVSAGLLGVWLAGGELSLPRRPDFLRLGAVEVAVVLGLLDALFLVFVLVQVRYLFGGSETVLESAGLTYAEYARRGFFELVTVTALALPLVLVAQWLLRAGKRAHALVCRALSGMLVGLLLAVVASALWRMRLYTDQFGLTELRLYVTAFELWLALILIWMPLTTLRDRREAFAMGVLISGFAAAFILNAINSDAIIVRANVARMENGERFDPHYLGTLSADAVPAIVEALPDMDAGDRRQLEDQLDRRRYAKDDWRTYNLSRSRADSLTESP
jgi:hypothetical protein